MAKMQDILALPIGKINKDGKEVLDTAAANVILKTYKLMDDRINGGAVQRIHEIKEIKQTEIAAQPQEVLDNKLAEIELKLREKELNGRSIAIPQVVPADKS